MGRTVPTYRMHLEGVVGRWMRYRRALREEDRDYFDRVMHKARAHASAGSFCPELDPVECAFLSVLIEMERELELLRRGTITTMVAHQSSAPEQSPAP